MLIYRIQVALQFWILRNSLRKIGVPKTLNEKIRWKSAYDRSPLLTIFADKIKVREYVSEKVGSQYLAKAYATSYDLNNINWDELPKEFVIKANHGCGGMVMIRDKAFDDSKLPIDLSDENWTRHQIKPEHLDITELKNLMNHFLQLKYCWFPGCNRMPEWAYLNIKPGVIIEELLLDEQGEIPKDLKFYMFDGRCEMVAISERTETTAKEVDIKVDFFSNKWEWMNVQYPPFANFESQPKKPKNLGHMIEIAEKLSEGIDFVRVDLYSIGDRIIFGELTNYPSAGQLNFYPPEFDKNLGDSFNLSIA